MEERSIFADLLAFANECRERGVIARAKGIPFTREYLASRFDVPVELLNTTITKCQNDANDTRKGMDAGHRLEVLKDETIVVTNWEHYQAVPAKRDKPFISANELRREQLEEAEQQEVSESWDKRHKQLLKEQEG